MRKNWIGTVVLVGTSMVAGLLLPQMWEHVLGQPGGFSAEPTQTQVVVNQPVELPKWYVEFVPLPPHGNIRAVAVVDTESKKVAMYHWEVATGKLWLLTVRDIREDLMLNQFNAQSPLPSELRRELQRLENK